MLRLVPAIGCSSGSAAIRAATSSSASQTAASSSVIPSPASVAASVMWSSSVSGHPATIRGTLTSRRHPAPVHDVGDAAGGQGEPVRDSR